MKDPAIGFDLSASDDSFNFHTNYSLRKKITLFSIIYLTFNKGFYFPLKTGTAAFVRLKAKEFALSGRILQSPLTSKCMSGIPPRSDSCRVQPFKQPCQEAGSKSHSKVMRQTVKGCQRDSSSCRHRPTKKH